VCFPPDRDASKTYTIDYEELEEFVAESHEKTPCPHPFSLPFTKTNSSSQTRVFNDLRRTRTNGSVVSQNHAGKVDEKLDVDDEKLPEDSDAEDLERNALAMENTNRFTFFSSEADDTVHASELGGLLMPDETFRDLFELGPD